MANAVEAMVATRARALQHLVFIGGHYWKTVVNDA
jgi:hypothetical protein